MKPLKPSKPERHPMIATSPPSETDTAGQLLAAAGNIETYRADLGMTKAFLLRSYPELGTDRTYNKIIGRDLSQLDVEKWSEAYAHVWRQIKDLDSAADDSLIPTLTGPVELCRSYLETRLTKGNDRFILIQGESGVGKTSAINVMLGKPYGGLMTVVEALDVWKKENRNTAVPMLRAIAEELGIKDLPARRDALMKEVISKLKSQRRCLVIEEAHHLCPQGLNTLKALINLTPTIIVATAIPQLWDKLTSSRETYMEVRQLIGNRLAERIQLVLSLDDIRAFLLARNVVLTEAELDAVAAKLREAARGNGCMKFVAKATARFQRDVSKGESSSKDTFFTAIATEQKRR
jgi:hypothetical protein